MNALCMAGRQGRADPCGSGAHLAVRISAVPCFAAQAERLTTLRAEAAGGEPFEMLDVLQRRFNISNRRVIVWTGSRVTTHNLRILLHYVKVAKPSSPSC